MKRLTIGIVIWLAVITVCGFLFTRPAPEKKVSTTSQVTQYLIGKRQFVELRFDPGQKLQVGDPIFGAKEGLQSPIGMIARVNDVESNEMDLVANSQIAFAELYPNAPAISQDDYLRYNSTPDSMAWVVNTMFPPEKRQEISQLIVKAYQDNQEEINTALRPIIQKTIEESALVINEDLKAALKSRSEKLEQLGARLQVELIEDDIIPLVQEEIWPVIEAEARPMLGVIGQEMWKEASVWRFGWRYLYDASPLPKRDLMKKEFDRFVQEHGVPILESHTDEFLQMQRNIMQQVSQNPTVQQVVSDSIRELVNDREVQLLFSEIFNEVVLQNSRLREIWEKNWNGEEAQKALAMTNKRLEPTITEIGESLFGNPHKKITPEFSLVLRNRVLLKDSRWLTLEHHPESAAQSGKLALTVVPADPAGNELPPFHIPARPRK